MNVSAAKPNHGCNSSKCASASVGYFMILQCLDVGGGQSNAGQHWFHIYHIFAHICCYLKNFTTLLQACLIKGPWHPWSSAGYFTVDHQAPQQQGTNRNHHHHHSWFRAIKTFQNLSHWNRCEQCSKTSLANNDTCSSLAHELVAWLPVGLPAVRGHVSPPQNSLLSEKCANSCWLVSLHKISYHQIRIVHCIIVRHVIDLDLEPLEFELGIRKYKVYNYIIGN